MLTAKLLLKKKFEKFEGINIFRFFKLKLNRNKSCQLNTKKCIASKSIQLKFESVEFSNILPQIGKKRNFSTSALFGPRFSAKIGLKSRRFGSMQIVYFGQEKTLAEEKSRSNANFDGWR